MFKNLFKNLKENDKNLEDTKEEVEDRPVSEIGLKCPNIQKDNVPESGRLDPEQQKQYDEGHEIVEETDNGEGSVTIKKPAKKATEKFAEYKHFYNDKFNSCKNLDEILYTYVAHTNCCNLQEDLRLRYVSMYVFNTGLSKDKLSIDQIKFLLEKKLFVEHKDEVKEKQDVSNTIDKKLYSDLKSHFERKIIAYQGFEDDISEDAIIMLVFSHYGIEAIDSDLFIRTLLRVVIDLGLPEIDSKDIDIRHYLKQRILNIVDTEFWDGDKEKIFECEIFIVGRYIKIKTTDFKRILFKSGEGPLYINASPLSSNYMFSIYIEGGTSFAMNTRDKDKILKYFKYINDGIMEEVNQKIKIILKEVCNPTEDLIAIIQNFLNIMPSNILLDRDSYVAFEHLTSFNSFVAKQMLDSDQEHREIIINKLDEDTNSYDIVLDFIGDSYKKLVLIAGKYIKIPEKYHSSVVWKILRQEAVKFMSEYWNNEYCIYIKDEMQITDLNEYVDAYCKCADIPTKNIVPVGLLTYYLMKKRMFPADINGNFVECNIYLIDKILQKAEEIELDAFENKLMNVQVQRRAEYSIDDVDLMDGHEFEHFVGLLFTKMGYMVETTKGSGDQGTDIIVDKKGIRIGIQTKCYSNKVTNKAVQEIFASLNHYNCNKGMVITNNYFTDSALELAQSNNIVLWDRDILKKKIEEIFNSY